MAITAKQAIDAARGSGGLITVAARRLGITRQAYYNLMNKYQSVQEAIDEEREATKDLAESKLIANVKAGKEPSIFFYLKTQAKDRGYVEKQVHEHGGAGGEAIPLRIEIINRPARDGD